MDSLRRIPTLLILLGQLWGCTTSSPKPPTVPSSSTPPPSSPPGWWTPQERMKAKKAVVEIYDKHQKSGGSGIILDVLNHQAYILTSSPWLKNYQPPLLVNIFYRGDHLAKLLYQDSNLALLSVANLDTKTSYYLSNEPLKTHESMMTLGFPKHDAPWTEQPLTYLKNQANKLFFSGQITEGYYGSPLIKEDQIIGMISKQETGLIHVLSVETIRKFLKASVPEAKTILARNDQRLMAKAKSVTQTNHLTSLKKSETPNRISPPSLPLEKRSPSPPSVSPLNLALLSSSLSKNFSPSLTLVHPIRKELPRPRETQVLHKTTEILPTPSREAKTIHMTPNPSPEVRPSQLSPSGFNRKTIKRSPSKPFAPPSTLRPSQKLALQLPQKIETPTQSGYDDPVLMNAMCSALETNDTQTFLQIARLLQSNHPLFYLARNLETAFTLNDKKTILQHSIKFLFEAFLLSTRSNSPSSCTQKLIRKKNIELEQLMRYSSQPSSGSK